tara:strand:+ start:1883 stop:2455 length:573 start_codon:yes stop_codon:yes gene_type:complete
MFIVKNKYFLIIQSIKDLDLKKIKKRNKFSIIYRNHNNLDKIIDLLRFRNSCRLKGISFFIANNLKLAVLLKADGIYLSSYNNSLKSLNSKGFKFQLIGSAHNLKEIINKIKQGCKTILLSKLFLVDYDKKAAYLGVSKFNNFLKINKNLIPLGGIKQSNYKALNIVNSEGLALLSEVKKKPTNIISRLF